MNLLPDERIEDLQVGGLKIIQKEKGYRFTTDAVLLANFVSGVKGKRLVELCSGSGVISILIEYKAKAAEIKAIEIQPELAEMSQRSVLLNNQQDKITVINGDAKNAKALVGGGYHCVVANPPYRKVGSGQRQEDYSLAVARHELLIDLDSLTSSAAELLIKGGAFFLVHQSQRTAEIIYTFHKYGIEPKEICFVKPYIDKTPNLVLIKGVKGAKPDLKILPDIIVFDQNGNYTQTVKKLYGEVDD